MDYNYDGKNEREDMNENVNYDAHSADGADPETEHAAPNPEDSGQAFNETERLKSGEYRYTPPAAEARTDVDKNHTARWSDPVIDKVQDDTGSFYSPNFRSNSSYSSHSGMATDNIKGKNKRRGAFGRILCIILACVILSAAASGVVTWQVIERYGAVNSSKPKQVVIGSNVSATDTSTTPRTVTVTGKELTGEEIYELGKNQVVGINTSVTQNIFGQETSTAVSGTGFIISTDGYILTNYHVIEYSAEYGYDLTVMTYDGSEYPAEIIGFESSNDVAVIKIDATGLTPVTFGNSNDIKVGEAVYAIGNPLGELTFTQTTGSISALDRVIKTDAYTSINMFQIDAAVNNGNSGGPVYNAKGEVIGIVTAKYASSGVEGLGFAIPINDAVTISSQLIENGYIIGKAYLGVNLQDIQSYAIRYYNVPEGAYVYSAVEDSCAAKSGIQAGDIITAIDDAEVSSVAELKSLLKLHSAGETVTITVYRSGESIDISVTLDEAPANMNSTVTIDDNGQSRQQGARR